MKIVFQKVPQWEGIPHAEEELARRMVIAAKNISLDSLATSDMEEIDIFNPDIVIPLYFTLPKLFDAFTVGCMWNPKGMITAPQHWDNIKSYDGFGISSPSQEQLVRALKFKSPDEYLFTKIYPSTNSTVFQKPEKFDSPVYIGSNWSKDRHKDFFLFAKNICVYGSKNRWQELASKGSAYKGELPCDGSSALKMYHQAGIGLALHHPGHIQEHIPSMRPFEIAASGAVMIADQHPFVRRVFGDNALYLDTELEASELASQLEEHVHWIKSHLSQAQEMAHACHEVFNSKFSLEVILENLVNDVQAFKESREAFSRLELPQVEIVVRTDGSQRDKLFRALNSLKSQTYPDVAGLVVFRGATETLASLKQEVQKHFPELGVRFICANKDGDRSTQFFTGIRESRAPYIGFLDHDDLLFSDHVEILMRQLLRNSEASLAYSGSVRVWEDGEPFDDEQTRKLAYFHELTKLDPFVQCLTSNSYLVRRSEIPWHILHQPIPQMQSREDYIFLVLMYNTSPWFLFSEKVTCAFHWRVSKLDNCAFEDEDIKRVNREIFDLMRVPATTRMNYGKKVVHDDSLIVLVLLRKILFVVKNDFIKIIQRIKKLF